MAGGANDSGGPITGINVTPLVDVMLVLLVIFMVTAKLVVAPTQALGVQLPQAASGEAVQVVFAVTLTKAGQTFVDGRQIASDAAVEPLARAAREAHPELRAVIEADGEVPHRRVIAVMDKLAKAQVGNIAFAVAPESGAAAGAAGGAESPAGGASP